MRIYIVQEDSDVRGSFNGVVRCLRGLHIKPKMYVLSKTEMKLIEDSGEDIDELIKHHFSLEDFLKKRP